MANMITVKVGSSTSERKTYIVESDRTVKSVLEEADINYASASMALDGANLTAGEINKTFDELGVTESCFLIAAVKMSNA